MFFRNLAIPVAPYSTGYERGVTSSQSMYFKIYIVNRFYLFCLIDLQSLVRSMRDLLFYVVGRSTVNAPP